MAGKGTTLGFIGLVLSLFIIAACTPASSTATKPAATVAPQAKTLTDTAGRTFTLARAPERIISLSPSNTEILFALGLGDKVVGVTTYCDFPPEAKTKEKIGSFTQMDVEKIASLKPDLIVAANIHKKAVVPKLEEQGQTVLVLDPANLEQVLDGIKLLGQATGTEKEAGALVASLQTKYDAIIAKVKTAPNKPSVFYEMSAQLHTTNSESFVGNILNLAGANNIAAESKVMYPQLNLETLILKNPDIVILADHGSYGGVTPEQVMARDGWSRVAAVKSKRIVMVNPDLVSRPGPRVVDGLEEMAKALHPDLFK